MGQSDGIDMWQVMWYLELEDAVVSCHCVRP